MVEAETPSQTRFHFHIKLHWGKKDSLTLFQNKSWFLHVCRANLLKTLWEKDKFLLFQQCFLSIWKFLYHFHQIHNCRLEILSVWKSLKFVVWERVKTLWEQEKMLVTSFLSFFYNVSFPPIRDKSQLS